MNRLLRLCGLLLGFATLMGCKGGQTARDISSHRADEEFRLEIRRSFHANTRFTLVRWHETGRNALVVEFEMTPQGEYVDERLVDLSSDQVKRLDALLTQALRTDLVDAVEGLDGSTWCLEAGKVHTDVRFCLWSPTYKSSERGMSDFAAFGHAVWEIAGAQEQFGELF